MEIDSISTILEKYFPEQDFSEVIKIPHGLINSSYKLELKSGSKYFLQKVNSDVFKDPTLLDENLNLFFGFMNNQWKEIELHPLELIKNLKGHTLTEIDGDHWRIMNFIEGGKTTHLPQNEEQLHNAGKAYARLLSLMAKESPSNYHGVISNFLDSGFRFEQLEQAAKNDKANRLKDCREELDNCFDFYSKLEFETLLPTFNNLCINDCKISNILFDQQEENVKAIVDFDTVMIGSYYMDFADLVRSGCSSVAEDDQKMDQVYFNQSMFTSLAEGFWANLEVENFRFEKELMWFGITNLIWQQFSRFLTDFLNGDEYYQVNYPSQNFERAKNQSLLLSETLKIKSRLFLSLPTLKNT